MAENRPFLGTGLATPQGMHRCRTVVGVVATAALVVASGEALSEPQREFVRVTVAQGRVYGRAAYQYRVENNNRRRSIVAFRVGDDFRRSRAQLTLPPYGWTDERGLPIGSALAPDGWAVEAIRDEAAPLWFVEWFSSEDDESLDIAPGEMRDGFTVLVSDAAEAYATSQWTVVFDNGEHVTGRLERER